MNNLSFSADEKESLSRAWTVWPHESKGVLPDLDSIPDTQGMYGENKQRDRLNDATRFSAEMLIGAGQWHHYSYPALRSALLKLDGFDEPGIKHFNACCHPPTGTLLRMYLLTGEQLSKMQAEGLKSLGLTYKK